MNESSKDEVERARGEAFAAAQAGFNRMADEVNGNLCLYQERLPLTQGMNEHHPSTANLSSSLSFPFPMPQVCPEDEILDVPKL